MIRKRHIHIVVLLLLLSPTVLLGQELKPHYNEVSNGYNFWLYTPDNSDLIDGETKPLIIFLHGASLRGNDLQRVRRYGVLHAIQMGLNINAYVLAPQVPSGAWVPERINNCLDWAIANNPKIDINRIYVIGMSLGGYGTIDYCAVYADRIAAAMAICGGGNPKNYCKLNEMPLWIVHGAADHTVNVDESFEVIQRMQQCDEAVPRLIYTQLHGVNHSFPARIFYLSTPYEWLSRHQLNEAGRPVNRDYTITVDELQTAYKSLRRDKNGPTIKPADIVKQDFGADIDPITYNENYSDAAKNESTQKKTSSTDSKTNVKNNKSNKKTTQNIYRIKSGDTLGKIARKHGTTVQKLCRLNGLKETSILQIGQKIKLR